MCIILNLLQNSRRPARRLEKNSNFFNMEKIIFVKNNFFLAIYCSESFTNVNYG